MVVSFSNPCIIYKGQDHGGWKVKGDRDTYSIRFSGPADDEDYYSQADFAEITVYNSSGKRIIKVRYAAQQLPNGAVIHGNDLVTYKSMNVQSTRGNHHTIWTSTGCERRDIGNGWAGYSFSIKFKEPKPKKPATLNILSCGLSSSTITVGDSVNITATVRNEGDLKGSWAIAFYSNGSKIGKKSITLNPGEKMNIKLKYTPTDIGDKKIKVGTEAPKSTKKKVRLHDQTRCTGALYYNLVTNGKIIDTKGIGYHDVVRESSADGYLCGAGDTYILTGDVTVTNKSKSAHSFEVILNGEKVSDLRPGEQVKL